MASCQRAARHRPERGLVEDRLGRGGRWRCWASSHDLERRRGTERHAVQQVRAQPGQRDGVGPASPSSHDLDIDDRVRREPEHDGVALDDRARAETAPDLGQAPAQRPKRVVGLGEQQRGELAAASAAARSGQVGQQGPALAAPELVAVSPASRSIRGRPSSWTDRLIGPPIPTACHRRQRRAVIQLSRAAVVSTRGSGKSSQYW